MRQPRDGEHRLLLLNNDNRPSYHTIDQMEMVEPPDLDYDIPIKFKGRHVYIDLTSDPKEREDRTRLYLAASGFVFLKVAASAGLRLYGLRDFFFNEDYIFYNPIISHLPASFSWFFIVYSSISDVHMNWFTRGPSTFKMLEGEQCEVHLRKVGDHELVSSGYRYIYNEVNQFFALHHRKSSRDRWRPVEVVDKKGFNQGILSFLEKSLDKKKLLLPKQALKELIKPLSQGKKIAKIGVTACSIVAIVSASVSTFLGTVTILKTMGLQDSGVLVILGSSVFTANLITNLSYRGLKVGNNLMDLMDGAWAKTPLGKKIIIILTSLVGGVGFLGLCNYGTFHALEEFFKLIGVYDPDTNQEANSKWKNFITNTTYCTLFPSMVSFFFSQCAEMVSKLNAKPVYDPNIIGVHMKVFRKRYHDVLEEKKVSHCSQSYLLPKLLRIFGYYLAWGCIPGELIGNMLMTLNGCIGLIYNVVTENPNIIGPLALILATVNIAIYTFFNVPDWLGFFDQKIVKEMIKGLKEIGFWGSDRDSYVAKLRKIYPPGTRKNYNLPIFRRPEEDPNWKNKTDLEWESEAPDDAYPEVPLKRGERYSLGLAG